MILSKPLTCGQIQKASAEKPLSKCSLFNNIPKKTQIKSHIIPFQTEPHKTLSNLNTSRLQVASRIIADAVSKVSFSDFADAPYPKYM